MSKEQEQHRSYLFTLRLWPEALGDDRTEWRGQVQYVTSGEMRYFRDWSTLVAFLLERLPGVEGRGERVQDKHPLTSSWEQRG